MISTIDIRCNAAHPEMPLMPFVAFKTSPSSVRILDVPKKIGNWNITEVFVKVQYPDNSYSTKSCVRSGNVWVGTLDGTDTTGTVANGFMIGANGIDENGDEVSGYILGVGDVKILDADGSFHPDVTSFYMKMFQEQPDEPNIGDAYFEDDILKVYDGTQWKDVDKVDLTDYIHTGDNWMREGIRSKRVVLYYSTEEAQQKDVQNLILMPGQVQLNAGANTANNTLSYNRIRIDEQGSTIIPYFELGTFKGQLKIASGQVDFRYNGPEDNWFRIKGYEILTQNDITPDTDNPGYALNATQAQCDGDGNNIKSTYATKNELKNNKITITQGGVEKGFFTLNQGTDKTIEIDAGGGGSSKCLLHLSHNGNSSQYVQWKDKDDKNVEHTYKISRLGTDVAVYRDGSLYQGTANSHENNTILIPVQGTLTINYDGYSSESMAFIDNLLPTNFNSIDTTGHQSVWVAFGDCLEQSTPISMADGTTKMVCELKVGDKVLSLNPDTLQLEEDEVSDCDAGMMKMSNKMDVWNFADGTSIKTIKPHQFFNLRTNKMEYIADFEIGDGVRKQDGTTTTLFGHETKYGVYFHNTLFTKKYNNYFANGILTGNRHSVKWGWYWTENNA